jgi:fructokinase
MSQYRIGVDFGGTKIEVAALGPDGTIGVRHRIATPAGSTRAGDRHAYEAGIRGVADLVARVEGELGLGGRNLATVGVGIPGVISPATGLVKNANSNALNGNPIDRDLRDALAREVRVENDANCFALSEAVDGAAAGAGVVFGVIIGTGCGGGIIVNGQVVPGRHRIAGEWGHNPLPWPRVDELPGPHCWCGRWNCLETLISGSGLARDCDGPDARDASGIPARAAAGEARAAAALDRHADRLARGLAHVVNLLDPDAIVLGGGLSNMDHLYSRLPALMAPHVFSDVVTTPILRNRHGDSSGVRGAAWLWPAA